MKRIIGIILALLMIVGMITVFASCSTEPGTKDDATGTQEQPATEAKSEDNGNPDEGETFEIALVTDVSGSNVLSDIPFIIPFS